MHRFEQWRPLILGTRSEGALLDVMNEFCSSFLPSEIARLPTDCQTRRLRSTDEIPALAVALANEEKRAACDDEGHILPVLARGFLVATAQLSRIRTT